MKTEIMLLSLINFCVIGVEKSDPDSAEEWLGKANYLNPNFVNTEINKKDANLSYRKRIAVSSLQAKMI